MSEQYENKSGKEIMQEKLADIQTKQAVFETQLLHVLENRLKNLEEDNTELTKAVQKLTLEMVAHDRVNASWMKYFYPFVAGIVSLIGGVIAPQLLASL